MVVPTHNDILLTQAIGRIRRDYRGKEKATVYVINDTKIRYANTYALLATRKVASLNRAREKGEER
jgi:superfamily II DNA or RNA helicase